MNTTFRRDRFLVSTDAGFALRMRDASRAFLPEPPAAMPKAQSDHVAAAQAPGVGGDSMSALAYACHLVRLYGHERAEAILRAEGQLLAVAFDRARAIAGGAS